jgi:hypothetical protein
LKIVIFIIYFDAISLVNGLKEKREYDSILLSSK